VLVCPKCQHQNPQDAVVCQQCGTPLGRSQYATFNVQSPTAAVAVSQPLPVRIETGFFDNKLLQLEFDGKPYPERFPLKMPLLLTVGRKVITTTIMQGRFIDLVPFGGYAKGVSKQHLRIEKNAEGVHILDLGSSNGTYLDGVRIPAHRLYAVSETSQVQLGQLLMSIHFEDAT
jgi:hypothetical protein